jgi:hypothetical protein
VAKFGFTQRDRLPGPVQDEFDALYARLQKSAAALGDFAIGDLLVADDEDSLTSLPDVALGFALISGGVDKAPLYGKIDLTLHVEGVLPVPNGGLGLSTVAQGDLLYGSATDVLSRLAKDANATRYLSNTGASNNPAWAQVNLADGVTGDLPFANLAPASAASRLLGRGSAAGAGDFQEITLGSGLTMTNQVLSASGDVTAAANLTDNAIVRGDGGAKGVQTSAVLISDLNRITGVVTLDISGATSPLLRLTSTSAGIAPIVTMVNQPGNTWHMGVFGGLDQFAFTRTGVLDFFTILNATRSEINFGPAGVVNISIGGPTLPTGGNRGLVFADGGGITGMGANSAGLYATDVAGTVEMFAIDEAGAAVQISSHNFTLFTPDAAHPYPWSYYSRNSYLGIEIGVNLARLVELVEGLTGETLLFQRDLPAAERRDWADDQEAQMRRAMARYETWRAGLLSPETPEPTLPVVKDPPAWLADRLSKIGRLNTRKIQALRAEADRFRG